MQSTSESKLFWCCLKFVFKFYDELEYLALEKKSEAKIMQLDLTSMNAKQQVYFQRLQDEIYEALMNKEMFGFEDDLR